MRELSFGTTKDHMLVIEDCPNSKSGLIMHCLMWSGMSLAISEASRRCLLELQVL